MSAKVRCRCGQELRIAPDELETVCPACHVRMRISRGPASRDVFLSHSSQDKTTADAACAILERHGLKCWMAPRDILPGADWSAAIIEGIERSRLLVLIYSQSSNGSPQVLREVERAVAKGMAIVPLRLDDLPPSKSLEYFISSQHWLDALTPPLEAHLETLAVTVKRLLQGPSAARSPAEKDREKLRDSQAMVASEMRVSEPLAVAEALHGKSAWWTRIAALTVVVAIGLLVAIAAYSQYTSGSATTDGPPPGNQPQPPSEIVATEPPVASGDEQRDPDYAATMRRRFQMLDAGGDGRVSVGEYANAVRQNKLDLKLHRNVIELLDADVDGIITQPEFLGLSDRWLSLVDRDRSGAVTLGELQSTPGFTSKDGLKQARELFPRWDWSRDGQLDVREIERMLRARIEN
jgi:Ca2+-binding EF-hand superfamily protein